LGYLGGTAATNAREFKSAGATQTLFSGAKYKGVFSVNAYKPATPGFLAVVGARYNQLFEPLPLCPFVLLS
jgi:hypothetical protein